MSSPYASCFRPSTVNDGADHHHPPLPPPPPSMSAHSNLTTCLYHTHLSLFSLTFSRSLFSRSFHLQLHPNDDNPFNCSTPPNLYSSSFLLHMKPFLFWNKYGSKKLSPTFIIFWDFTRARFGSSGGPEPRSGFYIAVVVDNEMTLLVGDLVKEAYGRTKAINPSKPQSLVLKKEQVVAPKIYSTKARIGGKVRDIQIDCGYNDDTRLCFSVDDNKVLQVKHLKWKFRGNEKIDVDGVSVQISWDVYNWVFGDEKDDDGHAIFMFRFEEEDDGIGIERKNNGMELWSMNQSWNEGTKGWVRKSSSSSSVSMSSVGSSIGSSSVMEWASVEESELGGGPSGFSLLVYAYKK